MRLGERTDEWAPLLDLDLTAEDLLADLDPGWFVSEASLEPQDPER